MSNKADILMVFAQESNRFISRHLGKEHPTELVVINQKIEDSSIRFAGRPTKRRVFTPTGERS